MALPEPIADVLFLMRKIILREGLQEGLRKPPRGTLVMKIKSRKGYLSEAFGSPLRDPLRGRISSWKLLVLSPLIVLPLNLSPIIGLVRPCKAL